MSHTDYHLMVNRGRKAGLNTTDLYRALSSRPVDRQTGDPGQTDCNGFRGGISRDGRVEYHPATERS